MAKEDNLVYEFDNITIEKTKDGIRLKISENEMDLNKDSVITLCTHLLKAIDND